MRAGSGAWWGGVGALDGDRDRFVAGCACALKARRLAMLALDWRRAVL